MKTWRVTLPVTGSMYIEVEADSEEEAIDSAWDEVDISHLVDWEPNKRGAEATCEEDEEE